MRNVCKYSLLTVLLFVIGGLLFYEPILNKIYGINQLSFFSEQEYTESIKEIKVYFPKEQNFIMSSEEEFKRYISLAPNEDIDFSIRQPMQLLYFDNGRLVSYHVNCYAEGSVFSGKINWNTDNRFDAFVPKSAVETFDLSLKDINNIYSLKADNLKGITIIVFWNQMFFKNSIGLIETLRDNNIKYNDKANIVFINTDKFYIADMVKD